MRFHKKARRRDHRKLSLLIETGQRVEKIIYTWRLDASRVGDLNAGRKIVRDLPPDTAVVAGDPAFDAKDFYEEVEARGARPVVKPRANARTTQVNARGRALRRRLRRPTAWQREYDRRPITESGNYAVKRRFGDRLWTHGLWRQRKEMGFRILVYNSNMVQRRMIRQGVS